MPGLGFALSHVKNELGAKHLSKMGANHMLIITHSQSKTTSILSRFPELLSHARIRSDQDRLYLLVLLRKEWRTCELLFWIGRWEFEMAKQGSRYGVDFVALRVSEEQKVAFQQWASDNEDDLPELLVNFVGDNYKVSLNLDARNDCYIASATGTDDNRINRAKCMTARSKNLMEALFLLLYKHYVMCEAGSWGDPVTSGTDWG
jgi:hypothetical protein